MSESLLPELPVVVTGLIGLWVAFVGGVSVGIWLGATWWKRMGAWAGKVVELHGRGVGDGGPGSGGLAGRDDLPAGNQGGSGDGAEARVHAGCTGSGEVHGSSPVIEHARRSSEVAW